MLIMLWKKSVRRVGKWKTEGVIHKIRKSIHKVFNDRNQSFPISSVEKKITKSLQISEGTRLLLLSTVKKARRIWEEDVIKKSTTHNINTTII